MPRCDAWRTHLETSGRHNLCREKLFGLWQRVQHQRCAFEIAHLTFAEQHDQRASMAVAHGMQF